MSKDQQVNNALKLIARLSIDKSSQVLSKMIKAGAKIELEDVYVEDISSITEKIIAEGTNEVVGTFIDLIGDMPFKFLFYVDMKDSLILTDLILKREPGSAKEFDLYASSAVQEIGNILSSAITNVFSKDFQINLKPTPPTVIHDYASTIFEEYILSCAADKNDILIIESTFCVIKHDIKCQMYILPDKDSESILKYIANST